MLRFGSYRHPLTVYYDARLNPPVAAPSVVRRGGFLENVFVPNADEAIRARIRKQRDPSSLAVVSRDREVWGYAEKAGARVIRVIDFLDRLLETEELEIDPLEPPEKYGR